MGRGTGHLKPMRAGRGPGRGAVSHSRMTEYTCAICKKAVTYAGPLPALYPFCSPRCQWVDLGHWLNEQYVINRELSPEEAAELGDESPPRA